MLLSEQMPPTPGWTVLTTELAEFFGLMTSEGYVPERGTIQFTNNNEALRNRVAELWSQLFLGTTHTSFSQSGWDQQRTVGQLNLNGGRALCEWLRAQLYAPDGHKRVPPLILNATPEIQKIYLSGYYAGDGLKAGKGDSVKTNSAVLAQGLCWLYANQGRECSVYEEQRDGRMYYQLNVFTSQPAGAKGQHLRKQPGEVRRVSRVAESGEWVFDLETETGVLQAGVGRLLVHNSPRRGLEFVTHKISLAVAKIKLGQQQDVHLGNLEARRDWGFAGDYVEGMWLMLQQSEPDDFVLATGETHSVREFAELAFRRLGLDYREHVVVDQKFLRPAEVELLVGTPAKAHSRLGWEPSVSFPELVHMMVDADLETLQNGRSL